MSPIAWMASIAYCSTIYYSESNLTSINLRALMANSAVVTSFQPWDHLDTFYSSPDCVTFLLSSIRDYEVASPKVSKSRVSVNFALILALEEYHQIFAENKCSTFKCHVALLNPDGDMVTEQHLITPYDANGKANNRNLSVSYLAFPPYIIKPGLHPYGIDTDILDTLASRLNLKLSYVHTTTFNEMVGAVIMGQADMSVCHAGIVWPRFNLGLDCTSMLVRNMHFGQRHPVPVDTFNTITYPFEMGMWLCTLLAVVTICVVLGTFNRYCYNEVGVLVSFEEFVISISPIACTGVPESMLKSRSRNPIYITLFTWFLTGYVLALAYKSNLLANLVKVEVEKQPQTFQELFESQMALYTVQGSILTLLLRTSPIESHRKVYEESLMKRGGFYPNAYVPQSLIESEILTGKAVTLLTDDGMAPYKHIMGLSQEEMFESPVGYFYRIRLPLREEINMGIMVLRATGVINEITRKADYIMSKASREIERNKPADVLVKISISFFLPMLFILLFGTLFATMIFVYELVTGKLHLTRMSNLTSIEVDDDDLKIIRRY